MQNELICKEIKKNKWLNGYYDMKDGDVMAMVVDKEYLEFVEEINDLGALFRKLQNVTGNFRYKNIVFANHWNYGCFVYRIEEKKIVEFEHLTISAYKLDDFIKDVEGWVKCKN